MSKVASAAILFFGAGAALILIPPAGRSHDPITTNITFNKEVVRILGRNCFGCHAENGVAQIPLTTYEQARPWAKAIKEEVLEKRMPPFQAVKGFGSFRHDYVIPQRDVDQLVSWVEGGVPRGSEPDSPRVAGDGWALGKPDLVLQPTDVINLSGPAADAYRCVSLPTNLTSDAWVAAIDLLPGDRAAVHCASFVVDGPPRSPRGKALSEKSDCRAGIRPSALSFGEWIPGQAADRLPRGVARRLPAGSQIVMRIHYRGRGGGATIRDRSMIGLYLADDEATKALRTVGIKPPPTSLPRGARARRLSASYVVRGATEAIGIRPLLYPLGTSLEATAHRPDGTSEVLVWAKDYRYDWQPAYYFRKPIALPKNTRIEVTAYVNNSDADPRDDARVSPRPALFTDAICELLLIDAK